MSYFLTTTSEDSCSGCFEQRFLMEEEEEKNVCQERSRYIYPKGAENTKKKFKYIVNLDNQAEFQQKVKVTMCLSPGESCGLGELVLENVETKCRQVRSQA